MTMKPEWRPALAGVAFDAAAPPRVAAPLYALAVPTDARRTLATAWLALALGALLASGLFSVLLVAARTPALQHLFPHAEFFRIALVVHVDLSVLVWFAAALGMLWSLAGSRRWMRVAWTAWVLTAAGTLAMAIAPFAAPGAPVMSNYVPVIDSPVFLGGLALFGAGFGLAALRALLVPMPVGVQLAADGALRFGLNAAAVAAAMTLLSLAWTVFELRSLGSLDTATWYELLFWGPGHVVQFCWTLMVMVAWLWLGSLSGARIALSPRLVVLLFGIGLASVFATPLIQLAWDVATVEYRRLFTWQMRFGGGLAVVPVAVALLVALVAAPRAARDLRPGRAALVASLLLFGAGGLIGFMIRGPDVRIPAHYHGAIVGITLALMGLAYVLLPKLGFARPLPRAATWQPWVYATGQLMHIIGLVWSGGYGVQRKVAGAEQVLRTPSEVAGMGLMGAGGAIAVIGGLMFAVVVLRVLAGGGQRRHAT